VDLIDILMNEGCSGCDNKTVAEGVIEITCLGLGCRHVAHEECVHKIQVSTSPHPPVRPCNLSLTSQSIYPKSSHRSPSISMCFTITFMHSISSKVLFSFEGQQEAQDISIGVMRCIFYSCFLNEKFYSLIGRLIRYAESCSKHKRFFP
jgi:hypothetical protein